MNFLKITLGVEKCTYLKCGASYPVKKKKKKKNRANCNTRRKKLITKEI